MENDNPICPFCGISFTSLSELAWHIERCSNYLQYRTNHGYGMVTCPRCNGIGVMINHNNETCTLCHGKKQVFRSTHEYITGE